MRGIFCGTTARNSEEYREVVRKRRYLYVGMAVLGIVTIIAAFLVNKIMSGSVDDHSLGFILGVGSGLTVGGLLMAIKTSSLMRDEEKLKQDRLKYKDERILEISGKALRTTAAVVLLALYIVLLITVMFFREFMWIVIGLIGVFFITYQVAYMVYSKKM